MLLKKHLPNALVFYLAVILLAALLPVAPVRVARAQDVPIVYEHFNTDMTLGEDGVLHVRIVQQIRFDGEFSGAFYAIPLRNVTSIANVQLYGTTTAGANFELNTVDLAPLTPNYVENNGSEVIVDWNFPTTQPGDVRLFVIEYDAFGVVWVYPDADFVSWRGVNEDRSGITVEESEVQLTLPEVIPMDQVTTTTNLPVESVTTTGQTISFVAAEPIHDGEAFIVEAYFPHGLLDVGVREWQRDYDGQLLSVDVERFHADMTIHADGTLAVQEETALTVVDGALHQGYRPLRLLYRDEIIDPTVAVDGQPLVPGEGDCTGCFVINRFPTVENWVYLDPETEQRAINEDNAGVYNIDWYAPLPIQRGESVTTSISFGVAGAIRVGEENQFFTWQVDPDFGQPVSAASFRLVLPPGVTPEQVSVEGPSEQGSPLVQPDGSLLFHFDGPVVPGAWQIAVTLPANATAATKPRWQAQFEETIAEADAATVARARNNLIQRVIGALALVGAILAGVVAWFRWGRRKVKETLGGYVSEPPSQQSPAMVSYLVDRKTSERGVLGTIFYLASLGLVEIDLEGEIKLRRLRNEPLQSMPRLPDVYGETVTIPRHVQILFDQVLLPGAPLEQWVSLDSIAPRLRATLPEIYASLAGDLQKFFIRVPGSGDDTIPASLWFVIYATLLGLMFFEIIPWLLGFVIGFIALLLFVFWSAIRETGQGGYTDAGALEADRWRRFKTYLQEIKKYGDQGAAQEIINRYFGYAVALGIEEVVLAQAAELGGLRPIWMPSTQPYRDRPRETVRYPRPTTSTGNFPWTRPSTPPPPVEPQRPTLAGMSAQLGDSIQRASSNLGSLLATAAGDADAAARTVTVNSQLRRREMEWKPNTPVTSILDDIMRQSVADAREIQAREVARRQAARRASSESSSGGWDWSSGGSSSSSSRSSSSFGRSSSSSSRSSSSSSSSRSSSSSSSRSGGGGRSGFR